MIWPPEQNQLNDIESSLMICKVKQSNAKLDKAMSCGRKEHDCNTHSESACLEWFGNDTHWPPVTDIDKGLSLLPDWWLELKTWCLKHEVKKRASEVSPQTIVSNNCTIKLVFHRNSRTTKSCAQSLDTTHCHPLSPTAYGLLVE